MKVQCIKCGIEFKPGSKYNIANDGLCGKCRSKQNYISNIDTYRKTNHCEICTIAILKNSKRCYACSQLENRNYKYCSSCNSKVSNSSNGLCRTCYHAKRKRTSKRIYNWIEWITWKRLILKRDNYTCQMCGKYSKKGLHAHHILPKRFFSSLVFKTFNGITLCRECHQTTYCKEMNFITKFFGF